MLLLLLSRAYADDPGASASLAATPLDPPLPIAGEPAALEITAYALLTPDPMLLTTDDRYHTCRVILEWSPSGLTTTPQGCTEALGVAAAQTAATWTFQPVGEPVPTRLHLDFILHYDPSVATLNTTVEVDPGLKEALAGVRGAPGLRMVHPAAPKKPLTMRLPKDQRALGATRCTVTATLDASPKVTRAEAASCPDSLAAAAVALTTRAKWTPRIEEGSNQPDTQTVNVDFTP